MKTIRTMVLCLVAVLAATGVALAATVVPTEVQQPGTQPGEVSNLETPDKCDNCHGGYNTTTEPAHNWRGSMMAQAGRDPIFWATVAVVEQDFDGAGDLCLRCHAPAGWLGGRSTPTDGSGLTAGDADGVECDLCHKLTNSDDSEHLGVMNAPFIANDGDSPVTAYYGSGMYAIWPGNEKLGPYAQTNARHQFLSSGFHRQAEFCGTCHDVSNPVVGDLAPNNGKQDGDAVTASAVLGSSVDGKAAFNNFPFMYGVVERTFSEHKASLLSATRVADYALLPTDLKAGAIKVAYDSALVAGTGGNYQDGTVRLFSCQSCHLRPITGQGCNKNPAVRPDLPLHDMTGGNYWMPDAIKWLDTQGMLRLGGGLSTVQLAAMTDGKTRAMKQLSEAASLIVNEQTNVLKVVNLTGHKLITGYPEGRRMWLNVKWYDAGEAVLREDGKYGAMGVSMPGAPATVNTLLDPTDPNTKIYEAHYAMTQEWAAQLIALGYPPDLVLVYDRVTGAAAYTLGELAAQAAGTSHESFHFALNNYVAKDNRIPPYGMTYEQARKRNCLPVPADQYGNPGPAGQYNYWDEFALTPPAGATYADIRLMYQPTSWEYIQFLFLANQRQNAFLANEGDYLLQAWLNTGMAEPYAMATAIWGEKPVPAPTSLTVGLSTWTVNKSGSLVALATTFTAGSTVGIKALVVDDAGQPVSGVQVFVSVVGPNGGTVTTIQGFTDTSGTAVLKWKTSRSQLKGSYTATVTDAIKSGYALSSSTPTTFTIN